MQRCVGRDVWRCVSGRGAAEVLRAATIRQHRPLSSKSCCVNNMNVGTKYSHVTSMSSSQQSKNLYKTRIHCRLFTTSEQYVLDNIILLLSTERTKFLSARSKEALCFPPIAGLNSNNSFSTSSQATGSVTWLKDRLWYCVVPYYQPMLSKKLIGASFRQRHLTPAPHAEDE